ncbi:conserved hypothetical protein [uncultured Paludibacter sp.]|uniref:Alkaline phosphatase n=1 Tax=uncultured Paludibacter sp. TaxID=497635 RepID=A0A653A643_9BACT|nr:conserved hypothetical protein [uncultured Paludibacter sp.]
MKNRLNILTLLLFISVSLFSQQVRPVKNIILMISDGTSLSALSASRWLKVYRNEGDKLNIDPYLCGTVTTFSSNAPIGDSAPTTSCYVDGIPAQAANIAMYPSVDEGNDLVKLDSAMTYQPLTTLLEAMQWEQKKSSGLVVTCEFPHATPADCSAHYYNRNNYSAIAPQMAFNNLNVMFGGGTGIVTDVMKKYFTETGTTYLENDKKGMLSYAGNKIWALFGERELPYDLDRDTTRIPSLAQMTNKALQILNKNKNGFFLMVEGSKVDWAAHANDPIGIMTEFLAFDKAVGEAINFAKKDKNTLVVVTADHGNSGFSIGRNGLSKSYTTLTLDDLFGTVSKFKHTAEGLEKILINTKPKDIKSVFKENTGIDLTDEELKALLSSENYHSEDYTKVGTGENMTAHIISILNSHTPFGFTTHGHTGEEVFLALYHPQGDITLGNRRNTELHKYMYKASGLKTSLATFNSNKYAKHTEVFANADYKIEIAADKSAKLVVKKGNNILEIPAFSSVAMLNGKSFNMGSVAVYVDKNNTFYISKNLSEKLK